MLFSGLLTSSLAWLTICGEDAPELITTAPVSADLLLRAKLAAACLPALVLVVPALLAIARLDMRAALLAAALCPVAAFGAGIQQHWAGQPKPRRSFRFRQKGSILLAISEYAMAGFWAAAVSLAVNGSAWAPVAGSVAVLILVASWLVRQR